MYIKTEESGGSNLKAQRTIHKEIDLQQDYDVAVDDGALAFEPAEQPA